MTQANVEYVVTWKEESSENGARDLCMHDVHQVGCNVIGNFKEDAVAESVGEPTILCGKCHDEPTAHECKELEEKVVTRLQHGCV